MAVWKDNRSDVKPKQHEAILANQSFEPGQPGPLLLNVQTLLDELATGITTTSKHFALPIRSLADLNERLQTPLSHKLKRPQLKSFPTLTGLFLLLRAAGLAVGQTKPKRMISIDPEMRERWDALNPTEQYMSLLNTWMTQVTWSILGEPDRFGTKLQHDTHNLYRRLRKQVPRVQRNLDDSFFNYELRTAVALLEQFGWIQMTFASDVEEGKIASVQSVQTTDFGDAMFATLSDIIGISHSQEAAIEKALKHLFPQWKDSLVPTARPFREGRYTLNFAWSKVWRRLATPAATSLEDVTSLLLESFDFDQEHLYQLEYRHPSGTYVIVADPRLNEGDYFADETRLGDLPLDEGDTIKLWYDFGDDWRFTITIESIDDSMSEDFEPVITAREGDSPKQYDDDDDDVDDDDDW